MDITILFVSIASMGGIGLALAAILAVADKKLAVKEDPRVVQAMKALPGANCGGCGYAGCSAFARALVEGKVEPTACKPGGQEVSDRLREILGLEGGGEQVPRRARVFCSGGDRETVKDKRYTGVPTCESANLVGGEKACLYSCLGYGDCAEACPFEAIHMSENRLPVIDLGKCTGCGVCVEACPRNIIHLTEPDEAVHVYCSSRDKGPATKKVCSAGCIACKLCEKEDDTGAVTVVGNLAGIDYAVSKAPVKATRRCPTKVIRLAEPVPGHEYRLPEGALERQETTA
jgi:RnfABCDGE-type electron transport complex B subunit